MCSVFIFVWIENVFGDLENCEISIICWFLCKEILVILNVIKFEYVDLLCIVFKDIILVMKFK